MNFLLSLICSTSAKPRRPIHRPLDTVPIPSTDTEHRDRSFSNPNDRVPPSLISMKPGLDFLATSSVQSPEMRIPHLPPELIHEILAHLHGEKLTLESCSLVCKAWVHPSRSHLFAHVALDDERLKRLLAFRQVSTLVIPYIRSIYLRQIGRTEFWNTCIPDPVSFQRVKSLTVDRLSYSSSSLRPQTASTFFTRFTGIVRFVVIGETQVNESQLADIICSFPRLEVLNLTFMRLRGPRPLSAGEFASSHRIISPHLHTLYIFNLDYQLLAWILSFESIPPLRTLWLMPVTFRILNNSLPHLRYLEELYISIADFRDNHNDFIDLSHQERLRSLHIVGLDLGRCLIHTLASITTTCLDELIVDVIFRLQIMEDIEWSEIDAVLQSPQFSNLGIIRFILPHHPTRITDAQLLASIPGRLPRCRGRGILSVATR